MKQTSQSWHSSYEEHNYGELFYSLMRVHQPEKVVELGTKLGYSAYHMARGLRDNGKGTLDCYDLWEKYVENYGIDYISLGAVEKNVEQFKDIVTLEMRDAIGVDQKYKKVDILHVDLDNDGEILEKIVPTWIDKVRQLIIIEGGSHERDVLASKTNFKKLPFAQWLTDLNRTDSKALKTINEKQYNKPGRFVVVHGKEEYKEKPIAPWLEDFSHRRGDIEYITFEPFPSVTIMRKKA